MSTNYFYLMSCDYYQISCDYWLGVFISLSLQLITPRHILLAIANDDELHRVSVRVVKHVCLIEDVLAIIQTRPYTHTHTHTHTQLLKGVTISQGGVLPHIPEVLLFRKSQLTRPKPRPPKPAVPTTTDAAPSTSKPGIICFSRILPKTES